MPTYRNDGTETAFVTDASGNSVSVLPGHSVQTHILMTETFWTKTAETPNWNPVLGVSSPAGDAVTDAEVAIVSGAKTLRIHNRSGEIVTVYFRVKTNTPGLVLPSGADYVFKDDQLDLKVDKLVIAFAGAVASGLTVIQTSGQEQIGLSF
jgi:hypothetical protein